MDFFNFRQKRRSSNRPNQPGSNFCLSEIDVDGSGNPECLRNPMENNIWLASMWTGDSPIIYKVLYIPAVVHGGFLKLLSRDV